MKLGLGTVQFGLDYGVSNPGGRTTEPAAAAILDSAVEAGVRVFDTAPAYGNSEDILGRLLPDNRDLCVVSKVSGSPSRSIPASLSRLRRSRLYACLVHQPADLSRDDGKRILGELAEAKARGLVEKIGVSVYGAKDIDRAVALFKPDVVQVPASVFDQRLLASGHLDALKRSGVEIHARSIFLQGVVLMSPSALPPHLAAARAALEKFDAACRVAGCSRIAAAMAFALCNPVFDTVLVGVTTPREWAEILEAAKERVNLPFEEFAVDQEEIVSPILWKTAS